MPFILLRPITEVKTQEFLAKPLREQVVAIEIIRDALEVVSSSSNIFNAMKEILSSDRCWWTLYRVTEIQSAVRQDRNGAHISPHVSSPAWHRSSFRCVPE